MAFSIERMRPRAGGLLAAGCLLACGVQDPVAPTVLPMPQPSQLMVVEEATEPVANAPLNTPPTIDRLVLEPHSPKEGEQLTAVVEASDAENDLIRFDFTWTVDSLRVDNSGPEFSLKDIPKGSWVKVVVVARDRTGRSEPYEEQVTVVNQPPLLRGIVFEPMGEVNSTNDVTASPHSYDPDGDDVTYQYLWKVNGVRASTDGAVLSADRFKRGDEIVLEVVANDGEDDSEPLISDPISVANARPRIVSTPSDFGGESFRYVLRVEDPDGDRALRFRLTKGPEGMTIDDISGKISWLPSSDQEGLHRVAVTVADSQGGEDTQHFELTLGFEAGEAPAALDR